MGILDTIRTVIQERKSISAFLIENEHTWISLRSSLPDAAPGTYQRHVIEKDDDLELVLIVWTAGSCTGFHGHPAGGCWLSVFEGPELMEDLPRGISNKIRGGYRCGVADQHSIRALSSSASIHVYKHS
jgi:hypothetical protein